MKSRTEILVPLAAIQAVPIAVIAWYRLHRYAWYRYSAIVSLDGEGEARAYVEHEILGDRLRECCKALLLHKDKDIKYIMGSGIDVLKLKTSMRLFNKVSPNDVFEEVLNVFF